MKLKTRVFDYTSKYKNPNQLALAMKIAPSQVYRVWNGERKTINEEFILGAVRAFPEYSLNDLFYVEGEIGARSVLPSPQKKIKIRRRRRGTFVT